MNEDGEPFKVHKRDVVRDPVDGRVVGYVVGRPYVERPSGVRRGLGEALNLCLKDIKKALANLVVTVWI